jgi:hypothetical protein
MLPEGYHDCIMCSTPASSLLCNPCWESAHGCAEKLGWTIYEIKRHKQWGVQVLMTRPDGTHWRCAPWTLEGKITHDH